jgi:hypothetical protein
MEKVDAAGKTFSAHWHQSSSGPWTGLCRHQSEFGVSIVTYDIIWHI